MFIIIRRCCLLLSLCLLLAFCPYLAYPGPVLRPFDHGDIWVFIDNLFLEGWLRPIAYAKATL